MRSLHSLLVTGGCGFIGSAFIRYLLRNQEFSGKILNLDLLTYAARLENVSEFRNDPRYRFVQGNICDQPLVEKLLDQGIDTIVHFAAETHVDRSIGSARPFVETNVLGTLSLLEAVRKFPHVHFHHVSTDEVYGSLGETGCFNEHSQYRPNSPYSASKAASDHLVRAFAQTYQVSTTLSHCSNNYGPGQYPEKLIPLMIERCLMKKPLPVYGKGMNVRDWLYVDDHAEAIFAILRFGKKGEVYDIGGGTELANMELIHILIDILAKMTKQDPADLRSLIQYVEDRPGHDFRYAIDGSKMKRELGWMARTPIELGLEKTVASYLGEAALIASTMAAGDVYK